MVTKLYGGHVKLEFDEKRHIYSVDGKIVPSVTGITGIIDKSGPLMWWAVGQCLDYVEENLGTLVDADEVALRQFWHDAQRAHLRASRTATDIGHLAHEWIEKWLTDENPSHPKNKKLAATVESFLSWVDQVHLEPIETEFKVYSRKHGFAGTCDFDGLVNDERAIVDWKTGKAVYPEHRLQTAAYKLAREEELHEVYDSRWVVILPKEGGEVIAERMGCSARDEKGFLGALALYRSIKGIAA